MYVLIRLHNVPRHISRKNVRNELKSPDPYLLFIRNSTLNFIHHSPRILKYGQESYLINKINYHNNEMFRRIEPLAVISSFYLNGPCHHFFLIKPPYYGTGIAVPFIWILNWLLWKNKYNILFKISYLNRM